MSIMSDLALRKIASEYDPERAQRKRLDDFRASNAKDWLNFQRRVGLNSTSDKFDQAVVGAVDGLARFTNNASNKIYNFMFNDYPRFIDDMAEDPDSKIDSVMRDMKSPIPLRYMWGSPSNTKPLSNSEIARRTKAMEDSAKSKQN